MKTIKLSLTSWHAKIWLWFTGRESAPTNGCLYFQTLFIILLTSPIWMLLCLPELIYDVMKHRKYFYERPSIRRRWDEFVISRMVINFVTWGIFVWIGLAIIEAIEFFTYGFFLHKPEWLLSLGMAIGAFVGIGGSVILIIGIREFILNWWENYEPGVKEEKEPNVIIEGIKSMYYKYCPKLEWKK